MYRTLGNIAKNPKIGLLFMAFDRKTIASGSMGVRAFVATPKAWAAIVMPRRQSGSNALTYTRIVRAMYQTSRQAKARSTRRVPVKRRPRRNGKGCLPSHRSFRMRTGKARPMVTRRVNDGAMATPSANRAARGSAKMSEGLHASALKSVTIAAALVVATASFAEIRKYDPGASDTEIRIGQTMPYSGPVSALSVIGKVQAAYFRMINDRGGINGRKINLISYDDAASPAKTVEQVRKLVEGDARARFQHCNSEIPQ